jgi:predicted kinase
MTISIPERSLVVLIGPSGSGKSTFARKHFKPTEVLSSDFCRGPAGKRSLALREFALGIEALEHFVRREPLRRVNECVFGALALESEPVDPRL